MAFALRVAGWLFAVAALFAYASGAPGPGAALFGVLCTVIGGMIATLVHEGGHALAALTCGWRIIVIVVRPIAVQFVTGRSR